MSTISIGRPRRRYPPDPGSPAIEVSAPPRQAESMPITGSVGMILVPAASGVGAVLVAVTQQSRPLLAAAGLLVLAASIVVGLVMVVGSRTGDRRRTREQRERYLDYLERVRLVSRDSAARQRLSARLNHPPPAGAAGAAQSVSRRWERRPGDADFMTARIGLGPAPPALPLRLGFPVGDPLVSYDEVCLSAAKALVEQCVQLPDQPICLALGVAPVVSICGSREQNRGTARALLAQLVWSHSPDEVGVVVISDQLCAEWEWLKWLPHNLARVAGDGPLAARLVATTAADGAAMLRAEEDFGSIALGRSARRLVVVVDLQTDDAGPKDLGTLRATARTIAAAAIHLVDRRQVEPELLDIRLTVTERGPGSVEWITTGVAATGCSLDRLALADAALLARSFAPLRPADEPSNPTQSQHTTMDSVRLVDAAALDPAVTWRRRIAADQLRVPIGVAADGALLAVDLKESAAGGMGPHGLVVGATGSGKSELLRTLVTALAISHPPDALALLLADFKGGATFSGLAALPHIAGMVTNLESDLDMVDRFRDALSGELQRRQELLAAAGKVSSLDAYHELQASRPELPTLPRLLVIVDEFSELLSAKPDLAELFVTIGRIGRSIGVHLLLATQRLDAGRIRGLESHLSYRICLRTFSEAESREAIGTTAAYRLPAEPGWAYLLSDTAEPVRFRASIVSRAHRPARSARFFPEMRILPYTVHNDVAERVDALHRRSGFDAGAPASDAGAGWRRHRTPTILEVVVERLTAGAQTHPRGRPVRRVWLEPLPNRLELGSLQADPALRASGGLAATLGLIDIPERQRQEILCWDFDAVNGNLLIIGAGRSGKSTALETLLCSLAIGYQPGDIAMICLDFGGGILSAYRDLPHVAAVAGRSDPELTRLVLARISGILDERDQHLRQHGLDSPAALRQARRAGNRDPAVPGDVVLVIDGWAGLRAADPNVETVLDDVLSRGPGLGVHTVLTVGSAGQLRNRLAAGFGGRIELRLSDAFDSVIDRRLAKAMPADLPGRCLVAGRHYAQLAVPVLSGDGGQRQLLDALDKLWPGPGVPRIDTLPAVVRLAELQDRPQAGSVPGGGSVPVSLHGVADSGQAGQLLLGVHEHDMSLVKHSLLQDNPHLLIYGDAGSGKTALFRNLLSQLTSREPQLAVRDEATGRHPTQEGIRGAPTQAAVPGSAATGGDSTDGEPRDDRTRGPAIADATGTSGPEVLVVDYRRGLPIATAAGRWLTRATEVAVACSAIANVLTARLHASPASRSSPGPEIYLLVDDYELVSSVAGNPLAALLPMLPHARDIGFHLIIARRCGGAARAQYEPVLQSLGDLGTPVLLLSGAPGEGRLGHGLVPQPLPPGRAQFAMRGAAPRIIQIGWLPADEPG